MVRERRPLRVPTAAIDRHACNARAPVRVTGEERLSYRIATGQGPQHTPTKVGVPTRKAPEFMAQRPVGTLLGERTGSAGEKCGLWMWLPGRLQSCLFGAEPIIPLANL